MLASALTKSEQLVLFENELQNSSPDILLIFNRTNVAFEIDTSGHTADDAWPSARRRFQQRAGNAFIESFNGRLRDELLNETLFTSLAQARVALACWRVDYSEARPHSQLGWKTPSEFAFTCHPRRELALRYAEARQLPPLGLPPVTAALSG
ncbi:hypothetical protein ACVWWG_003774 [Bradyrhizobium sp. LB7.2]